MPRFSAANMMFLNYGPTRIAWCDWIVNDNFLPKLLSHITIGMLLNNNFELSHRSLSIPNPMQLHKIRACPACHRHTTHNHHMLPRLSKLILQQTSLNESNQILGCAPHLNTMEPDTPP